MGSNSGFKGLKSEFYLVKHKRFMCDVLLAVIHGDCMFFLDSLLLPFTESSKIFKSF